MPNKKAQNKSLLQATLHPFFKQGLLVLVASLTVMLVGCEDNSTEPKSADKAIANFKFEATKNTALAADVDGTISGNAISITLPTGTDVSALTPTIDYKGESIDPASGAEQDFSSPVTYTVTAEDGTTLVYTVTVTVTVTASKIAVDTYTSSTNLGPAIIDSVFEDTDRIATVSNIPQNAAAKILIKTGSGSDVITTTLDVTAANNEAAIPKSELNALITASTNSLSLRISVTQGDFVSNEVTLTYTHNAIYSWQDLQAMRQRRAEDYTLMNDIAFPDKGVDGFPAAGFEPVGQFDDASNTPFTGSFDGGGHTISNFSIARPTLEYVGLFGFAKSPAMATSPKIIQDVIIIQSGIEGSPDSRLGTLAGILQNVTIDGIGAESTADTDLLKGGRVGGLIGETYGCQVNGYAKVNIGQPSTIGRVAILGGLIGTVDSRSFTKASVVNGFATGDITAPTAANSYVVTIGGLVGRIISDDTNDADPTTVTGYATGNIRAHSGESNPQHGIGGLIGWTYNGRYTVQGYARGTITKTGGESTTVGQLVGSVTTADNGSTNGSISGYRSGKTGESTRTGVTTPSSTVNDGTAITVTATTAASDFSNLTFGSAVGEWAITTGEWPAINLSTAATGALSTTGQPTTR